MPEYDSTTCALFYRSRDLYGALTNMAGRMPLYANGMYFQSSEGLYQALKFPHNPEIQAMIGGAKNGYDAKQIAYHPDLVYNASPPFPPSLLPMPDWNYFRIYAMRIALAAKLQAYPEEILSALKATGTAPIVEASPKDAFWGAPPISPGSHTLSGENMLGRLFSEMRSLTPNTPSIESIIDRFVPQPPPSGALSIANYSFTMLDDNITDLEKLAELKNGPHR